MEHIKYQGLSDLEVTNSRKQNGINELEQKKKESIIKKILSIFKEPMFLLLLVTSTIYFFLGEVSDGLTMLIFISFIIIIETIQERRTDKALEALNELTLLNTKVIRNGKIVTIDNKEIVVGDIVVLSEGDKVPADGIILENQELGIDESILTGESTIVYKTTSNKSGEYFKKNICYSGTVVSNGSAIIRIEKIGKFTEYGKISSSINNIIRNKTPLEKQVKKLVIICTIISLIFLILVVIINITLNPDAHKTLLEIVIHSILAGITVAMATIPEEIPVVLTVFMAMGAWSLARKHTLVRNMNSVETLGSISVLCVDKTGTLTKNQMAVKEVYEKENIFKTVSALSCPVYSFDPMEKAIVEYVVKEGIPKSIYDNNLIHEYIFTSETKMVGKIWNINNKNILCVKGAYESVLPLCKIDDEEYKLLESKIANYSSLGYRVIAVAYANNQNIKNNINDYSLTFAGLIALEDPPKHGVKESIQACYRAGIRVIMITGDSGETARGIANQLNIKTSKVITGLELEKMSDKELNEKVKDISIFARVYPNHKTRIVEALQFNNEVVAMTGDGVNDAAALKKAEIGIAMGKRGTNVAKEASDMVLTDDNFNTIVDSIENGRAIYSNIVSAMAYIILIHIPIALLAIIIPLFDLPLFILPVHVVLLELIIDPTSSIIFQRIKHNNLMNFKPRKIGESLVSKKTLILSILQGLIIFLLVFISYYYCIKSGYSKELAVTISFSMLMFSNIFVVYSVQSNSLAIINLINNMKDKVIRSIHLAIILGILLIIYLPFLNSIIGTVPLSLQQLIFVIIGSLLSSLLFDLIKIFNRR